MCPTVCLDKHVVLGLKRLGYNYDTFSSACNYILAKFCKEKLQCTDGLHCGKNIGDEKPMGGGIPKYVMLETQADKPIEKPVESDEIENDNPKPSSEGDSIEEEPKSYYCSYCKQMHRYSSPTGAARLKYKSEPPADVIARKTRRILRQRITKLRKRPTVDTDLIKELQAELDRMNSKPIEKPSDEQKLDDMSVEPAPEPSKLDDSKDNETTDHFRSFYRGELC